MKKLGLFILAVMFLTNTVVVSAWAKPCLMNNPVEMSQNMDAPVPGDMPCHDNQNEQKNTYCEGFCLCVHASISQIPIMNSSESLNVPIAFSNRIAADNETMASRTSSPPRRPPKLIS